MGKANGGKEMVGVIGESPLIPSQKAAREATSRELPVFTGAIEQWPLFIASYERSTIACGFTEEENLLRLQKALKGPALDSVDHLLYFPEGLSEAMDILRAEYGRPELIVESLVDKVRRMPPLRADKFETLAAFGKAVRKMCGTIRISGLQEYNYNVTLLKELSAKLPPEQRLEWARLKVGLPRVTVEDFGSWIWEIGHAASRETNSFAPPREFDVAYQHNVQQRSAPKRSSSQYSAPQRNSLQYGAPQRSSSQHSASQRKSYNAHMYTHNVEPKLERWCTLCHDTCASLADCGLFLEMSCTKRDTYVARRGLCTTCLNAHKGKCFIKTVCGVNGCLLRHHSLLHQTTSAATHITQLEHCNTHAGNNTDTLLRYVPVIISGNGKQVTTYALIDEGSSSTFVDKELIDGLGIAGTPQSLCLRWTSNTTRVEADSVRVALKISGTFKHASTYDLPVVHTISDLALPSQSLPEEAFKSRYSHLKGLPFEGYQDARPRILIGADNCYLGKPQRCAEGKPDQPIATKTRLGWTVFGPCGLLGSVSTSRSNFHICICNEQNDEKLNEGLKDYFSLESLGIAAPRQAISKEDERALRLLSTETRLRGHRYETALLWKYDDVRLPCNRNMALKRYSCLRNKMARDPDLANAIREKIREYETKGYVRRMSREESTTRSCKDWYLLIFPVSNANKPGKMRIVFDAAAKVNGISLNTFLLTGPDQLVGLMGVLYKFREFKIAVSGDIREMFFQVKMKPDDQRSQMFIWNNIDEWDEEPSVYAVTVMTFGAACSPGSAHYVKNLNAERFAEEFPRAVSCIKYEHYVDDMLASVETIDEAVTLVQNVKYIHAQGGFEIRNWLSNSSEVVSRLQGVEKYKPVVDMNSNQGTEKVLGMWWNTLEDTFVFQIYPKNDPDLLAGVRVPTKREVLRILMTIFDPLGLIGNFLMFLKILLQDVWRAGNQWDDKLQGDAAKKWQRWITKLPDLKNVNVRRCYRNHISSAVKNVQLHVFCDASKAGMAAVAYLRFEEGGRVECALVGSKTRVAPLKLLWIPRLELQAAIIGGRLARYIVDEHRLKITKRTFWTDSRNVVSWIKSDHKRYSPFVAFRVSELIETTNANEWKWLSTKANVADDGTKWQKTPDMNPSSRWFRGPDFLWESEEKWPTNPDEPGETLEELRTALLHHVKIKTVFDFGRFSRWKTLLRTVGYIHRYVANLRRTARRVARIDGPLTYEELLASERSLLIAVQWERFPAEIRALKKVRKHLWRNPIGKESALYKLTPELDGHGILRMCGRLSDYPDVETALQRPIILPRRHPATDLVIRDYHERYCHRNHRTVLNQLRIKYYIPKLLVEFNRIRRACQRCKNESARPNPPLMGNIPRERVAVSQRAFTYTGIDYFGPMMVVVGRRSEKRWGAIFTCLTTRAVHLELAHSLTTASCILAIRRFIARRGTPREIISDRGTNFVGAARELREALKEINEDALINRFSGTDTKWSFNPPAAPHFGGCWERLVQSVKRILSSFDLPRLPTDEVLLSTLAEIEMMINSRPLTYVPLDGELDFPITPNHLLLGSSDGSKAPLPFDNTPTAVRCIWTATQKNADIFWKRWVADYLPTLTRRAKWFVPVRPIKEGDVVLIVDANLPRNSWPMGRVVAVTQAADGQVRRATVQTMSGVLERPASKIAVLDVEANAN